MELWKKSKDTERINLEANPQIRFTQGSDYLGCQIDLKLIQEDNIILLSAGMLFGVQLIDWDGEKNEQGVLLPSKEELKEVMKKIWTLVTGAVAALSFEKGKVNLILPPVDLDQLILGTTFQKSLA